MLNIAAALDLERASTVLNGEELATPYQTASIELEKTGDAPRTSASQPRRMACLVDLLTNPLRPWRAMRRVLLRSDMDELEEIEQDGHAAGSKEQQSHGTCGLPIGAGPEGIVHMPDFYAECRLSRRLPTRRHSWHL